MIGPGPASAVCPQAPGPLRAVAARSLTDAVLHLQSDSRPVLSYYLYRPRGHVDCGRILVSVHGVSRNAREHVDAFRAFADRYGVMLLAPVFSADAFRDYQRLGRAGIGPRADLALIRVLNELTVSLGIDTSRVDLFGFSGGAQFAHRFAYAHGQRLRRLVLGAAGWYTMPDPAVGYPYGTRSAKGLDGARLNPVAFARLPTLVLVGGMDDREDDDELNRRRIVCDMQGLHRVERARRWADAMNKLARRTGRAGCVDLRVLPGVGHSFVEAVRTGRLGELVFEHCYGVTQDASAGYVLGMERATNASPESGRQGGPRRSIAT